MRLSLGFIGYKNPVEDIRQQGDFMKRTLLGILVSIAGAVPVFSNASQHTGAQSARVARRASVMTVEGLMAVRRTQCMNSFGHAAFCDCINGYLPMAVDFRTYVSVTTASAEPRSPTGTAETQRLLELVRTIRDHCVASVVHNPR
jgi:hypothetical protein